MENQKNTININDLQGNIEEYEEIEIKTLSNNIKINFLQLYKYSSIISRMDPRDKIQNTISQNIQNLQKNHFCKEESISIFFKLLNEKNVEIDETFYYDLYILSDLFKVNTLKNFFENYFRDNIENIDFVINSYFKHIESQNDIAHQTNDCIIKMETLLSRNINTCLENEHFGKLPIPFIHRIIKNSDIIEINNDLLYSFILKSLSERYSLFFYIELNRLSKENIDDLCNRFNHEDDPSIKQYYKHIPNDFTFIQNLKNEILQNENDSLNCVKEKEIVKVLLPYININSTNTSNKTILHCACEMQNNNLVKCLVSLNSTDINLRYHENSEQYYDPSKTLYSKEKTALHIAVQLKNSSIVKILLDSADIDVNIKFKNSTSYQMFFRSYYNLTSFDLEEKTALHIAIEQNDTEIVRLLLAKSSIDVNAKWTYTHDAYAWQSPIKGKKSYYFYPTSSEIEKEKWEFKKDMSSSTAQEKTALHIAVQMGNIEIIKLLLNNENIDIKAKDSYGKIPIEYTNNDEIISLLNE